MARVCDKCWQEWISKKAVANAGVVVINPNNQVLLLYKPEEKEWGIPSGSIDKEDEEIAGAATRELEEETGIILEKNQLLEIGTFIATHSDKYPQPKTDVIVTFLAFSDAKVTLSGEHKKWNWFSLRENMPLMHLTTKKQLKVGWEKAKSVRKR